MNRIAFALAILLALAGTASASGPGGAREVRAEPEMMPAAKTAPAAAKSRRANPARIARIPLERPSPETIASHATQPAKPGAPTKVGFPRSVPQLANEGNAAGWLDWDTLPGGARVAAMAITSPEAVGMRIGLRIGDLPSGTLLRFYADADEQAVEITDQEVSETIARNLAADGSAAQHARTFWSPVVEAPTIVLEIEIPAGANPAKVRFAVPEISHLFATARNDWALPKAAGSCNIDATCHQATWSAESSAVARMLYTDSGSSYLCTGTLLADSTPATFIPYFLTANHCISTQTVASTLATYWFYRSVACNSGVPGSFQLLNGGATLLYASGSTDTSFMALNTTPPAGAMFAGWTTGSAPAIGANVTGIHHPAGDLQKVSFGDVSGYYICFPVGGGFDCNASASASATFYRTAWTSGVTEGGSSGSGLFLDSGHYLIGQLYGGSSSCGTPTSPDFYGRFSVAYSAALHQWLAPGHVLTVDRTGTGTGTVISSPPGINCGTTCTASFSAGTLVILNATPTGSSAFSGWSGGGCSGTGSCSVTMNADTTVTATFELVPPPANDDFATRIVLASGATSGNGTNVAATEEPGEPNHAGNTGGRSVWWSWTASATGPVTIHTSGSIFDTLLAVYTGNSVSGLMMVASNNDAGPTSAWSSVTFNAMAGVAYQIAVDGYNGGPGAASGAIVITVELPLPVTVNLAGIGSGVVFSGPAGISCMPTCTANFLPGSEVTLSTAPGIGSYFAGWSGGGCSGTGGCVLTINAPVSVTATFALTPANNQFANRIVLAGASAATTGSSAGATKEASEPNHAGNPGGKSVWWSWTAPSTQTATITTAGSSFDTLLAVYTGTELSRLTTVTSNDDDGELQTSAVSFAAISGTTYQIAVDGRNAASGSIVLAINPPPPPAVARPRDLSGDGKSDALLRGPSGEIVAWLMNGPSISSSTLMLGAGSGYAANDFGDFNGDGKQDLLLAGTTGELVQWLLNGDSVTASTLLLGGGTGYVVDRIGDFDGDGKADILFKGAGGDLVAWQMNGATVASSSVVLGTGTGFAPVAVGDFDNDGKDDIVLAHIDGRITIWLMNGTTIASSVNLLGAGTGYVVSHVGDFNNDSKSDLMLKGPAGEIVMWQMNGTAIANSYLLYGGGPWMISHVGDLDGDGFDDLVLKGSAGEIVVWQMNGSTITSATLLYGGGPWVVTHIGDYNGDGKSDLLLKGPGGEIVEWVMNGSSITSATLLVGATAWLATP